MKFLFFILFVSQAAFAVDPFELPEEDIEPETQEILIKKPEKYLRNESMIYDFNTDLGINDQRKYTGTDRNKLSLSGHVSSDYEHVSNILGYDLNYMRRTTNYNQIWYGFQFFQHKSYFDAITQNQPANAGDNVNDESQTQRPNNVKTNLLGTGLGVGYRFKLLMEFFQTEDVFESIDVFTNYIFMDDSYTRRHYKGYGLTTNYGIHKRSGSSFFYGGKFSYNMASVTRNKIGTESKSDRSFTLGWLSVAFEMGFFY